MRFTLKQNTSYAMEMFGPEFGPAIRHCSPIEVRSITPAGGGNRRFDLAFYHAAYAEGVRDKRYTVETIERSEHFLFGRVVGSDRLILLMALTETWLQQYFPQLREPE